ncbi:protein transporter [Lentinula aff. detonsa]|uniref:Phospholipid-transporting ATPase n=1 Tax=Lentinula aff. detonsa TaxID=2804958 RepID=A0AA38L5G6_9AGAR|nr:protein transporter [Lentinula aff. detonsa]
MPDIPLRSFRNKQAGYQPIDVNSPNNISPTLNDNDIGRNRIIEMNRSVSRVAAVANADRSRNHRARRPGARQRYVDDPEEAVGLLDSSREGEAEEREGEAMDEDRGHMMLPDSSKPPPTRVSPTRLKSTKSSKPKGTLYTSRTIPFRPNASLQHKFPANIVRNQKYSLMTFFPIVLYEQFKFFFNLYFLLVALSQFVPALKIGFIATYIAPLAFVLTITIGKEAYDDYKRNLRDREANGQKYLVVDPPSPQSSSTSNSALPFNTTSQIPTHLSTRALPSSSLLVGHLVRLQKNDRVPTDMVLLWTSDPSGTCFVRTDQLDGETDWKMRISVGETQSLGETGVAALGSSSHGGSGEAEIYADAPTKDIHTFIGTFTLNRPLTTLPEDGETHIIGDDEDEDGAGSLTPTQRSPLLSHHPSHNPLTDVPMKRTSKSSSRTRTGGGAIVSPLTAENALWANTVLASSGTVIGFVIYTGTETRAVMNTSKAGTKVGLLEVEVNGLAKILCTTTFILSVVLVALNGFRGGVFSSHTLVSIFRFLILFSSIIPISLRVNLDLGKSLYSNQIMTDSTIPNTIVRTSTLPEELGRVEYLLSDKTGTLTRNEMEMRKLHMGTMSYGQDSMDEVGRQLALAFASSNSGPGDDHSQHNHIRGSSVALAHTGSHSVGGLSGAGAGGGGRGRRDMSSRVKDVVQSLALCHNVTPVTNDDGSVTYQASSPDEVAIVGWTQSIGLTLVYRDRTKMVLRAGDATTSSSQSQTISENLLTFDILSLFPFTSESKRMGIIVRDCATGEINFLLKGADVVMARIVQRNDWLEEETGNMAREGLRTLVVARKRLSGVAYAEFEKAYHIASTTTGATGPGIISRAEAQAKVVEEYLEKDMELLGLTGVEDRLQDEVRSTLELMRNAGVKVWMLTGDKVETARCIAISTKMVGRGQYIHEVAKVKTSDEMKSHLDFLQNKLDCCLVIDGESLQLCLNLYKNEFVEIATKLSAVVACRCSPTQKADIARLIRAHTGKRVCCIGDGGNDVSMIQAADVGVGIVGKEGRQASLAADFSLTQFSFLSTLLLWHGRLSYRRSATLAQFVIHRGLIISIIQAVFSAIFYFAPIALYQGWLMVGYATVYTMMPVFSLVLDRDVSRETALVYPELYKELVKGRVLGYKSFFEWVMISVYQGAAIMIMSLVLFENEFLHIVSISFTALVLNELIMVALEITTWHTYMIISEVVTLFFYVISIAFLPEYFDLSFVVTVGFAWKVAVIVGISAMPLWIVKVIKSRIAPAASSKLL